MRVEWKGVLDAACLAVVAAAAIAFLSTGPVRAGRLPRYGGDVRVVVASVPASVDPLRLGGDDGARIAACLYEGLTRWNGADVGPGLARSWTRDEEGRRWRFQLRPDVLFHDGTRCDAHAVRQSLARLADPRNSAYAWVLADLVGWEDYAAGRATEITGLDVPASDAIDLTFTSPVVDLPARLALPAASIARRKGAEWSGTGPFQLLGTSPGRLRLAAFRDHHAGRPYLDHVEFASRRDAERSLTDEVAEMNRVLVADPLPAGALRWRSSAARLGVALVRPRSAVLGSEAARDKLAASFDRAVFVRAVLGSDGEPTEGFSPAGPKSVTSRNAESASGELGGRASHRARILVAAGDPVLRALGERLQVHLFAQGLGADLDVLPPEGWSQAIKDGEYDVAVLGWTPPQPALAALEPATRAQLLVADVVQPVLGNALPEGWTPARLRGAKDPQQALLRGRVLIPLVFFHDIWQSTSDLLHFQPAVANASLEFADTHLEPQRP